ncbi:uncharacterized protein SAMN05216249_103116 [Acetitomaculum ruminis DSM 5522]|uniref:HD domain-containing protein n=1 Tax=Acetitomaculum ruminis DSM 5522 TaxID=1120918 RepID=A0A1I0W8H2_9FIRM|nr:HD domain-containing protein [Acetitomaculum ruminis]SFA84206.1 uncharacterized protein SAMN05216249_103116 [Acetitomaculum ruminis DSM 5522]
MKKIIDQESNLLFSDMIKTILKETDLSKSIKHIQHGRVTVLEHSINVAYYSLLWAILFNLNINKENLLKAALLHDYFLYDWHEKNKYHRLHGFTHPYRALNNARKHYDLSDIETDIIVKHMFPLTPFPPKYKESILVCMTDKACSLIETFHLENLFKGYQINKHHFKHLL